MKFEFLRLKNFRTYTDLSLDFPSGVIIFWGENGQGKTNLMEAFHYLLRGDSFRAHTVHSLIHQDVEKMAPAAVLSGRLLQKDLHHDLKVSLQAGKKQTAWNGKKVSSSTLSSYFPLVLFSPESLSAIKEGPELRRELLDDVVRSHSPGNVKILKDFRYALKTRNRILKDVQKGILPEAQARPILESLDPTYLPLATELTIARLKALKALQDDLQRAASFVLESTNVEISVEYLISSRNAYLWERAEILSQLHLRSLELRSRELLTGSSLVGPHKHDIRILFSGKDSRFFCSQGQQRALILSFKMAQILYHYRAYQVFPILLLDDVLSELDPIRRTNLIRFLRDIPAQIFLTTTDLSFSMDFGDRGLSVYRIEKGKVQPQ